MPHLATVASFGFDDIDLAVMLPLFRALGCSSCQFYRNPQRQPSPADARRIASDAGLVLDSIHGVFGPDIDPSSPDEARRRAGVEVYRLEAELALRLGGPMVVVHPGPPRPGKTGAPHDPAEQRLRRSALRRSMDELAAMGEAMGVAFLVENLPATHSHGFIPPDLAADVRAVASPRLRMCFDTGHAHLTGDVPADLAACADVVAYLHVSDNDGKTDLHQIPGDGDIPWDAVGRILAPLPPTLPAMLELFHAPDPIRAAAAAGLAGKLRGWLGVASA